MQKKYNLLVLHGGGPTAVLNASLYGILRVAGTNTQVDKIYGARNGTSGLLANQLWDLSNLPNVLQQQLPMTPGSVIGTSRNPLSENEYVRLANILKSRNIGWVLCTGGNGTMEMCFHLTKACSRLQQDIRIMGVPKTMDNDLLHTDHCPGYGSAARYMAQSTRELCTDVKGLPIHVVILEALGRNAGWVTAAAALAACDGGAGPDLIYVPERAFCENEFLEDISKLLQKKEGVVAVVSEGLRNQEGVPIVPPLMEEGRAVYYGDVSAHLASLVIQKLGYKARSEKPGLLGRASIALQSPVDRAEAQLAGESACHAVLAGESGKMVTINRKQGSGYGIEMGLVELEQVMLSERTLPQKFLRSDGKGITKEFTDWCLPLLGEKVPQMACFEEGEGRLC